MRCNEQSRWQRGAAAGPGAWTRAPPGFDRECSWGHGANGAATFFMLSFRGHFGFPPTFLRSKYSQFSAQIKYESNL